MLFSIFSQVGLALAVFGLQFFSRRNRHSLCLGFSLGHLRRVPFRRPRPADTRLLHNLLHRQRGALELLHDDVHIHALGIHTHRLAFLVVRPQVAAVLVLLGLLLLCLHLCGDLLHLLGGLPDGLGLECADEVTDGLDGLVESAGLPCRGEQQVTRGRGVGDVD